MVKKGYIDKIFSKWLESADNKQLKKRYKDWITKSTTPGLNPEDTVTDFDKFLVAKIQVQEKPAELESRDPKHTVPISNLNSKGPFYEFDSQVEFENWDGKPFVKIYKSIKPRNCTDCNGKGFNKCDCDRGLIQCNKCKGNTSLECSNCNGIGEKSDKIDIINGITQEKKQIEQRYQCQSCYGDTTVACDSCSGLGKVGHNTCSSTGKLYCKRCKGTGQMVDVYEEPVPIKPTLIDIFYSGTKDEHDLIVDIIKQNKFSISKVDVYKKEVKVKDIVDLIVDTNKSHEKFIKELNKLIKKQSSENVDVIEPITLYSGTKLICKSTKGHSFEIWSFGEALNFETVSINF